MSICLDDEPWLHTSINLTERVVQVGTSIGTRQRRRAREAVIDFVQVIRATMSLWHLKWTVAMVLLRPSLLLMVLLRPSLTTPASVIRDPVLA